MAGCDLLEFYIRKKKDCGCYFSIICISESVLPNPPRRVIIVVVRWGLVTFAVQRRTYTHAHTNKYAPLHQEKRAQGFQAKSRRFSSHTTLFCSVVETFSCLVVALATLFL